MSLSILLMPPAEPVDFELRYSEPFTLRLYQPQAEYFRALKTERSEGRIVVEIIIVTRRGVVVDLASQAHLQYITFPGWREVLGNYPENWELLQEEAIRVAVGFQLFMAKLAGDEAIRHLNTGALTLNELLKASPQLFKEHAKLQAAFATAWAEGTLKQKAGRPKGAVNPRQFELLLIFEYERRRLGSAHKAYEALLARKDCVPLLPISKPENAITTLKERIEDLRKQYGDLIDYHDPDE